MSRVYKILLLLLTVWIYCACAAKKKKTSTASTTSGTSKTTSSSSSSKKESTRTQKDIDKEAKSQADIQKKLEQLRDKINKNGVVSLTDDTFSKFVTDRPREYNAVLMFTATDPMYKCGVCVRAKGVFEDVAKAYNLQYNFTTASIEDRVVFFRVEVDDARQIFGSLQLETVPRFYALPPTTKDSPKLKLESLEIESRSFLEGLPTAIKFVSEVTKVKIQILNDPTLALLIGGFLSILLALFVTYGHRDLWGTFLFYQSPSLWVVISVICFGVGVSGSIFCIIRSAPPLGYGMRGDLAIFAPQGRDQYSVEGVIIALLTVGSGLSFFFMYLATKIRFPLVRHVLVIFFMTVFAVLCLEIWKAYTLKTMWYSLRETFPAEVWTWLTSSVKKNSGLAKRLVRVSELWLSNTKDFATFYKKFEQLVIDYVKRIVFESTGAAST